MFVGVGVGVGRQRFAGGFADSYSSRVLADGGTIESLSCVANASTLLQQASLLFIPSGYKAGVAYSALPNNGNGDLTWSRNSTANRTNSSGVISSVGANVPRLSYMYGSCPSALLEPQRTNLCLRSNAFSDAGWSKSSVTTNDNSEIGIDGNLSASLITTSSTGNFLFQVFTCLPSTTYTFTFYVKRGTMTDLKYRFRDQTNNVDVIPVTSYYSQTNSTTFTRITVTLTTPSGCTLFRFSPIADTGSIGTCYITSAQIEQGSYATTYIPTTTASATRIADSFSRNNIYTNGLISASGGTWFVELKNNVAYVRDNANGFYLGSQNSPLLGDVISLRMTTTVTQTLRLSLLVGGSAVTSYLTTSGSTKLAIKWNGTTADVFENGNKVLSSVAFTPTVFNNLDCTPGVPTFIQQMALFNTPLSDSDCITLTT